MAKHEFNLKVKWTGNTGEGTINYKAYERSHTISILNKPDLLGSSDPAFRGDGTKYNPEDLLIASISVCHMLWYLHLCADAGIVVTEYSDKPNGTLEINGNKGKFTQVTLHPEVTITEVSMIEKARVLHEKAHELCFIANSCNFPIYHEPLVKT